MAFPDQTLSHGGFGFASCVALVPRCISKAWLDLLFCLESSGLRLVPWLANDVGSGSLADELAVVDEGRE